MTKLARFRYLGLNRLGVVKGDDYIDVTRAYASLQEAEGAHNAEVLALAVLSPDALAYLQGGSASESALREALAHVEGLPDDEARAQGILVKRSVTRPLVPIPNPPKIVCVARNYGKHAEEAGLQLSEIPILFPRFAATLIADGDSIVVPFVSEQLDWEGELAVVIGRGGRHITKEAALQHVAGYTIFNDVTVRDYQFRVTQYTGGKNFHASGPIGPHLALVDESIDPHNLRITTRVNGVVKQDANTDELLFDIPTLIEHISEFIELEPGDIIATGTPAGVGFKRNPPEYLRDGDIVDVTIENLGTISNSVRNESLDDQ